MLINSIFYRLAVALAVGLLLGFERGWSTRNLVDGQRMAGLRTFGLIGLTGGVCAIFTGTLFVTMGLFVLGSALILFHYLEYQRDQDLGATTFVAALLTYGLGALAVRDEPLVAAATATVAAGLLASKSSLHAWIRAVTWRELQGFLILLAMTILVLPMLPRYAVDPWGALIPAEIWSLAVVIASLSFVSHGAVRLMGERAGVMVSALAGGLVSSTAMGLLFARSARRQPENARYLAGAALLSSGVMAVRTLGLVGLARFELLSSLVPPLATVALVTFGAGAWLITSSSLSKSGEDLKASALREAAPFDLFLTLRLAGLIGLIMLCARLARQAFGAQGLLAVSFFAGLGDVDAVTLSLARSPSVSQELAITTLAIGVAVFANTIMKTAMAFAVGGRRHGFWILVFNGAALSFAGLVLLIFH
jgi:uncharacterized membrane protein (DUF4010 family)